MSCGEDHGHTFHIDHAHTNTQTDKPGRHGRDRDRGSIKIRFKRDKAFPFKWRACCLAFTVPRPLCGDVDIAQNPEPE